MKPVLIVYATREGHTHKIAGRIAESLAAREFTTAVVDAKDIAPPLDLDEYSGVVVAASVHLGRHEPEVVTFVKGHRESLAGMPAAFLSVSLAEAGAELAVSTAVDRAKAAGNVQTQIDRFFTETDWHPHLARPVAGALMYSQYGWLVKWVMRRIARKAGLSSDTSTDHEYTDWQKLDDFVDTFVSKELSPTFKFKTL